MRPSVSTSTPTAAALSRSIVNFELRRVEPEVGIDIDQARIARRFVQHRVDHDLQLRVGPRGLDHAAGSACRDALPERRRVAREGDARRGSPTICGASSVGDLLLLRVALVPRLEAQERDALRHGGTAGDHEIALGLRDLGEDLLELLGVAVGVLDGRAFGRRGRCRR